MALPCLAGLITIALYPNPVTDTDSKVLHTARLSCCAACPACTTSPASQPTSLSHADQGYRFRSLVTRSQPITEMGYQLPDDATLARGMARARISDQVGRGAVPTGRRGKPLRGQAAEEGG